MFVLCLFIESEGGDHGAVVRGVGGDDDVRVLLVFTDDLDFTHLEAFAFEVDKIDAVMVGLGVIGLCTWATRLIPGFSSRRG